MFLFHPRSLAIRQKYTKSDSVLWVAADDFLTAVEVCCSDSNTWLKWCPGECKPRGRWMQLSEETQTGERAVLAAAAESFCGQPLPVEPSTSLCSPQIDSQWQLLSASAAAWGRVSPWLCLPAFGLCLSLVTFWVELHSGSHIYPHLSITLCNIPGRVWCTALFVTDLLLKFVCIFLSLYVGSGKGVSYLKILSLFGVVSS